MREIRFRAWSALSKSMIYEVSFVKEYENGAQPWVYTQFTGLLDKNGKDIYDGDILQLEPWGIVVVEYLDKYAAFGFNQKGNYEFLYEYGKFTILGNIYENPGLLEHP